LECLEGTERNLDEESLAGWSVLLFIFSQFSTVNVDLLEVGFQVSVVNFILLKTLGNFVFQIGWLAIVLLNDFASCVEHL
jgi:hypothetical protein